MDKGENTNTMLRLTDAPIEAENCARELRRMAGEWYECARPLTAHESANLELVERAMSALVGCWPSLKKVTGV